MKEYYSDKSFTTNELVLIAKDTFEFINTNNIEDVIEQVDYMCEKTIDFESMLLINYFLEKKKGLRYGISIAGLEEYADRIFSNTSKLYDTLGEAYQNDTIDDRKWELVKILQDDAWELATILGDIENYIRENAEDYNKIIERKKHLMEGNQLNSHNCAFDTP